MPGDGGVGPTISARPAIGQPMLSNAAIASSVRERQHFVARRRLAGRALPLSTVAKR